MILMRINDVALVDVSIMKYGRNGFPTSSRKTRFVDCLVCDKQWERLIAILPVVPHAWRLVDFSMRVNLEPVRQGIDFALVKPNQYEPYIFRLIFDDTGNIPLSILLEQVYLSVNNTRVSDTVKAEYMAKWAVR